LGFLLLQPLVLLHLLPPWGAAVLLAVNACLLLLLLLLLLACLVKGSMGQVRCSSWQGAAELVLAAAGVRQWETAAAAAGADGAAADACQCCCLVVSPADVQQWGCFGVNSGKPKAVALAVAKML
jgi:hypothetical protein